MDKILVGQRNYRYKTNYFQNKEKLFTQIEHLNVYLLIPTIPPSQPSQLSELSKSPGPFPNNIQIWKFMNSEPVFGTFCCFFTLFFLFFWKFLVNFTTLQICKIKKKVVQFHAHPKPQKWAHTSNLCVVCQLKKRNNWPFLKLSDIWKNTTRK